MKAQPFKFDGKKTYSACQPEEATHVNLCAPGPFPYRRIPVVLKGTRKGSGCWSWNGDTERPTLRPSILTRGIQPLTNEEIKRVQGGEDIDPEELTCHSWINDGKIQFLSDCTHEFAGKTMDLEDV